MVSLTMTLACEDELTLPVKPGRFSKRGSGERAVLAALRQGRGISQVELAARLSVSQPNIAQVERQTDMLLSTLNRHIEALGGKLDMVVRFPDRVVPLRIARSTGKKGQH